MPDIEGYPQFKDCDTAGFVYSGFEKLGLADGISLSMETELASTSSKQSGDTERASSGICCAGLDALEAICAAGGVAGRVSEFSVMGEQVEHVWITSGVFGAGALNGGLLSNSV
jgi:hypothetical protein